MIAGVGGGFVVCSGTVAALVICKMKRPKIDTGIVLIIVFIDYETSSPCQ